MQGLACRISHTALTTTVTDEERRVIALNTDEPAEVTITWRTLSRFQSDLFRPLRMPESLPQQLPPELVLQILECAARDSIATDRAWVVNLALVSRFVYELVRPVLYHTMVVTGESNEEKVTTLFSESASAHVFHAIRRLVVDESFKYWQAHDLHRFFSGVTSIDAPLDLIETLSACAHFRPRVLAVRYCWLARFADELPRTTLASVTHLSGFFPSGSLPESALTDAHVTVLFSAMPALTHFGLDVLDLSRFDDDDGDEDGASDGLESMPLDLDALERTLRAALRHPRIQIVAMRVGGDWAVHWASVLAIAQRLKDTRVHGWHDTREMQSWARESKYATADAWAGRTIWTESSQLWEQLQ